MQTVSGMALNRAHSMDPTSHFPSRPKILFLDIGDTILGWSHQAKSEAARKISEAKGQIFDIDNFDHATCMVWKNRNGASLKDVITQQQEFEYWLDFYTELLELVDIANPPANLVESLARLPVTPDTFTLFNDTLYMLKNAHKQGIRLGAISNAFISVQGIFTALQLQGVFEPLILSYQVGVAKPQPEIYHIALKEAKVSPQDACFVDDRPIFVEAALKEKMSAVLLDRENVHASEKLVRIHSLSALESIWKTPNHTIPNHHDPKGAYKHANQFMEPNWVKR